VKPVRSRAALLSRLERLEGRVLRQSHTVRVRFGRLRRLPQEYKGERHVVITKELGNRNGQEWVEYEEMPGPDPNPQKRRNGASDLIDVRYVEAYPFQGDSV
jgi:hypothetical protein